MNKILIAFFVIGIVAIGAGFYFYEPSPTGIVISDSSSESQNANVITIRAERFEYTPSVIKVKKGERVKIIVDSTDTTHGIVIPDFGVSGLDSVEFTVDKAGTFTFNCPTFCGEGHREMSGTLIVEE